MNLDLRSIIIMNSIMLLVLAVILLFQRRSYPKTIRGPGLWAGAALILLLSALLFAARGLVSEWLTVMLANFLLLSGISVVYVGMQVFFGLRTSVRLWLGVCLGTVLVIAWYTLIDPSFKARVVLVPSVLAGMMLALSRLIWRHGRKNLVTHFTLAVILIQTTVFLLRALSALLPLPGEGLLDSTFIQSLYIVANVFITAGLFIGLILMAAGRLHEALEQAAANDSQRLG